jgi:hypothetical protein
MREFRTIVEGPNDHVVLRNILVGFFGSDLPRPNRLHPRESANPKGGWDRVLKALRKNIVREALQQPDVHVVIHIDTDVSNEYGVPHEEDGRPVAIEELVLRVVARLTREMKEPVPASHAYRVLFAITVHSMECWLAPLHLPTADAGMTSGCSRLVSAAVGTLAKERDYENASQGWLDRARLLADGPKNPSMKIFLERLAEIESS